MPIPVTCPQCGHQISAPDNFAGKKARCAKCRQVIEIPVAEQLAEVGGEEEPPTARVPRGRGAQRRLAGRKQDSSTTSIVVAVVLLSLIGVFGYKALKANNELSKRDVPAAHSTSNSTTAGSRESVEYTHEMGMDGYLLLYDVGDYANPETAGIIQAALFFMNGGIDFNKDITKHASLSKGTLILVRKMEIA